MPLKLLLIAIGGGTGSVLRYLVQGWVQSLGKGSFPVGTLVVNVTGCLAIGFLASLFLNGPYLFRHDEYRVAILVGVLGGYTTFSSYAWESLTLATGAQFGLALLNVVLSNVLGLAAAWLGARVMQLIYGTA